MAFFCCWSPRPVTLHEFAAVAGGRWGIGTSSPAQGEANFATTRSERTGPRTATATLSVLAHAFPAVTAPPPGPAPRFPSAGTTRKPR
jgi:hypothetical protein